MKITAKLNSLFQPESYQLDIGAGRLRIIGKKLPPPSQRITLHQKGLKVVEATITARDMKGLRTFKVIRINHLPSFEQLRIHTDEIMYPGDYEVSLKYRLVPEKAALLKKTMPKIPGRYLMPSIDEPEAWQNATFELKS